MSDTEVDLNFDETKGIPPGTYLFKVLDARFWRLKDDTGAPGSKSAIVVEVQAVAGTNGAGIGQTHEEFFHLPKEGDTNKASGFKKEKLNELAIAGKLADPTGKKRVDFILLKDRQIVATIGQKDGFTNLSNIKASDDASVAHIVSSAPAPVKKEPVIV